MPVSAQFITDEAFQDLGRNCYQALVDDNDSERALHLLALIVEKYVERDIQHLYLKGTQRAIMCKMPIHAAYLIDVIDSDTLSALMKRKGEEDV